MKELSIKEKAEAYDRALKYAKIYYTDGNEDMKMMMETCFPILVEENEDEKIRKAVHIYLDWLNGRNKNYQPKGEYTIKDMLVWVEKQGEIDKVSYEIAEKEKREFVGNGFVECYEDFQDFEEGETYWLEYLGNDNYNVRSDNLLAKTYHITPGQLYTIFKELTWLEKQSKQKTANNVKPKFYKGDWIVHHGTENIYQVVAIIDNQYQLKYGDTYTIQKCADVDKCARLWDISDAKNGDILAFDNDIIVMFKDLYNLTSFHSYCHVEEDVFSVNQDDEPDWWQAKGFHPATKEQCDILFAKMKEAGYEWNNIDKKPKKIEPFDKYEGLTDFERTLADICSGWIGVTLGWKEYIKNNANVLLKIAVENFNSVQDAPFEQKPAWSEEDEEMFKSLKALLDKASCYSCTNGTDKILSWLESLKERYTSTLFKLNVVKTVNQINSQMK